MNEKKCTGICKKVLPISEFNKNSAKKDGYGSCCRSCMKTYRKKHYEENKEEIYNKVQNRRIQIKEEFNTYRQTLSCEKCGDDRCYVLDFHHLNPEEKEDNVTLMVHGGYSWERVKKEIDKCIVLCANCHRELHHFEK